MTGIINKTGALKQRIAVSRGTAGGGGGGSATFDAIADGSITAGDKCILRSDGKVSALPNIDNGALYGETYTNGQGVVDNLGAKMTTVYDTVNNKIIALYQISDAYGTTNYNKAGMRHGTVNGSGKTITWGDEVIVSYSEVYHLNLAFDPNTGVIVACMRDKSVGGNYTYYCTIRTAKINGTGFDLGTQTVIHSNNSSPYAAEYDDQGQRILLVTGQQSSDKRCYSLTTNSNLSFTNNGYINLTNQNFSGSWGGDGAMKPGSDGGMLFCASWKTNGSGEYHPKAITIYWTGSAYALGTEIFLNAGQSAATAEWYSKSFHVKYDPDTGNFVTVRFRGSALGGEYPHPDARDLVSTVVTVGTPMETTLGVKATVLINESSPDPGNGEGYFHDETPICLGYHEGVNRYCLMHIGEGDGYKGWMRMGEIDGSGQIVWGGETGGFNFDTGKKIQDSTSHHFWPDGIWDPDEEQLIMFWDRDSHGSQTNEAMYAFIDPSVPNTRLTKYNFIGIAAESVASGGTAKIQLRGQVDDSQSGLTIGTEYFVRKDGTLATTADSHIGSVPAGKALSATQILIKAST